MLCYVFFCFKQKTAYELRISDWSSDVCSSDLIFDDRAAERAAELEILGLDLRRREFVRARVAKALVGIVDKGFAVEFVRARFGHRGDRHRAHLVEFGLVVRRKDRSEEHTSELQSLMRISYAVFCLKKKIRIQFKLASTHERSRLNRKKTTS